MADEFDPKEFENFKSTAQFDPNEFASFKQAAPVNTAADVAKSAGVGLGEGVIGLAGLPGDLSELGARGLNAATQFVGNKLGVDVAPRAPQEPYGSEFLQKKVEEQTGPFYQPQTTAGKYAQTIGQFAPAAIGGPESLATRIGTRVVAPAIASEAAGQATEGTPLEGPARITGALAGGLGAGALANRAVKAAVPTLEELETAKTAAYNHPAVKGLQLYPDSVENLSNNIKFDLLQNKVDALRAPSVTSVLDNLQTPRFGPAHTVDDLDLARQSLRDVPFEEKRAAAIARKNIDNYLGNIPQTDVLAGDAKLANQKLLEARANTAAIKRTEDIENAIARGENQAASTHSGKNVENATRQQLRPILNEKEGIAKKKQFFQDYTPEEVAALRKAVVGTTYGNAIRAIGNQLGGGGGFGNTGLGIVSGGEAYHQGASPIAAAGIGLTSMLAGRALRSYGNRMAINRANAVSDLLRQRSPVYQARQAALPPPAPSDTGRTAFLNALAAMRQSQGNITGGNQ